jgi:hypothetical protein
MRTTLGVAVLGAALVLGTGCGAVADKATERATEEATEEALGGDAQVDVDDDGNVQIESEDGSASYGTGELPDDWPDDIPMPDDTEITAAISSDGTSNISGTSSLSPEEVDAHFADLGWESTSESNAELGGTTSYYRTLEDGGRELSVTATEDPTSGDTIIGLVLRTTTG